MADPGPLERFTRAADEIRAEVRDFHQAQARAVDVLRAPQAERERDQRIRASLAARRLLESKLTPDQAYQFAATGAFLVQGSEGGLYVIGDAPLFGTVPVQVLVTRQRGAFRAVRSYCIAPVGDLPAADVWLAHKLALETDERTWRRTGNPSGYWWSSLEPDRFTIRFPPSSLGSFRLDAPTAVVHPPDCPCQRPDPAPIPLAELLGAQDALDA